jgi:hypothetical protein
VALGSGRWDHGLGEGKVGFAFCSRSISAGQSEIRLHGNCNGKVRYDPIVEVQVEDLGGVYFLHLSFFFFLSYFFLSFRSPILGVAIDLRLFDRNYLW